MQQHNHQHQWYPPNPPQPMWPQKNTGYKTTAIILFVIGFIFHIVGAIPFVGAFFELIGAIIDIVAFIFLCNI